MLCNMTHSINCNMLFWQDCISAGSYDIKSLHVLSKSWILWYSCLASVSESCFAMLWSNIIAIKFSAYKYNIYTGPKGNKKKNSRSLHVICFNLLFPSFFIDIKLWVWLFFKCFVSTIKKKWSFFPLCYAEVTRPG